MAERTPGERFAALGELGPNAGIVEEMYRLYHERPEELSEGWREFFADYVPRGSAAAAAPAERVERDGGKPAAPPAVAPTTAVAAPPSAAPVAPAALETEIVAPAPERLRGAAVRIVDNMEASLGVPTATSVRTMPATLLEVNREILNNHLRRTRGGKVSFTHLIAFAVLRAIEQVPAMGSVFLRDDGAAAVMRHEHVNLGIAIDERRSDGSRTLIVPNIKQADTLDFAAFHAAYEELLRRVRTGRITPDDLAKTTVSITNPGMLGTVLSVPRLMPGQGLIVGVGSIDLPAQLAGADPRTAARLGIGKVVTLTSTYDHRVIQGAESGTFLSTVDALLRGDHGFYDGVFRSMDVPYEPARWHRDHQRLDDTVAAAEKALAVAGLVNMYRVRGHLIAHLDPLGRKEPRTHPELDPTHWGLSIWDLDREFTTGGLGGRPVMTLREILGVLRDAYSRTVGIEYMHIQEPDQKAWIQHHVEGVAGDLTIDEKTRLLHALNAAEAFERFLHLKYLGQKRFSLEGAETLVPMLQFLISAAGDAGVRDVVMGMAHRGRLNVLANVVGKSFGQIFREFEGEPDPAAPHGTGDVKYHLGATGECEVSAGRTVKLTLAANPSHLEAVDPVVEGMARAMQDADDDTEGDLVLPVLIHGDAAFAGQGVVAETLNLSAVPGYDVGGTVHLVVNNQLGFTTPPGFARSSVYATDIAKAVQAPIFHVNGDDPEAAVRVIRLAFAFRQRFRKDVVVDLVCYRRYGHNEADEPAFTQPRMYALIAEHRSVRKLYTEALANRGDLTLEECEASFADFQGLLQRAFEETGDGAPPQPWAEPTEPPAAGRAPAELATGVPRERLSPVVDALTTFPEGFQVHPKLGRLLMGHRASFDGDAVDWALAEALAFGSLVLEGTAVRLSGQDTRRGTFSQRHSVLIDTETEAEHVPLANLAPDQARFAVYDSVLSEFAVLGFEYGYSVASPETLVLWEAQFGDFMNEAQTIIDQFVAAAEEKWGQRSGIVLLLPHGFEGQGPEHSSARIERFLALAAGGNLRIAYPTTAAQYFHVLRRQATDPVRAPLVLFTPKRYLRVPATRSPVAELAGGRFQPVLADPGGPADGEVAQVLVCSGKVAFELMERRDGLGARTAVVRVEQIHPSPDGELAAVLGRYRSAAEVVWVQEEPANMGARAFMAPLLRRLVGDRLPVRAVARPASGSPATGSHAVHARQQEELIAAAFSRSAAPATAVRQPVVPGRDA